MEIKEAASSLSALAHETRLAVFRRLVEAGPAGLAPGELAESLVVPGATMSFHLKELVNAGLIQADRRGRSIQYSIAIEGIRGLMDYLTQDCCSGRPELCGIGTGTAARITA